MSKLKKIVNYENIVSEETKQNIIKDYVDNFLSIRELSLKYNIKSKTFISKIIGDKKRSLSEAGKLAHKKKPESFKLNEESKNKIRNARLKFMKEHPEQTAWRRKNESYPEKCFIKMLSDYGFNDKSLIYREYSIFPYFIDFAFFHEKIAVEVDGSQHLDPERAERDKKKDLLLLDNGWSVIHFTATDVIKNPSMVAKKLREFISGKNEQVIQKVGILMAPKRRQSKQRDENGKTEKQKQASYENRKVKERPSKEELYNLLCNKSFLKVGKLYGVSDKTIVKWCRNYGIPSTRKEYDMVTHKVTCDYTENESKNNNK